MARKKSLPTAGDGAFDADGIRSDILAAAMAEFALNGFAGARIMAIAEKTLTSKRMIYYYFGDKEGLYRAVLARAFMGIREAERQAALDKLPPLEALRLLVDLSIAYHAEHPEFVRLVMDENIREGADIEAVAASADSASIIPEITKLLRRGEAAGVFRAGLDPIELHMLISALAFYPVSNRFTFRGHFGRDPLAPETQAVHRFSAAEAIVRYCRP